jgi:hypothetical protein
MGWRTGLLTVSSALLLAGCGGGQKAAPPPPPPRIPAGVAAKLADEADRVAALTPGSCEARDAAARFRADVIASIGRIPARYQEPLTSAANTLAERLATCAEPKPGKRHKPHHEKKHEKDR